MAHPLDPLDADEIRLTAATLRAIKGVESGWRYASINLVEPTKQDLGATAASVDRVAQAICWNTADGQAYRALVSLLAGDIAHWEYVPGIQPNMTVDEWHECDEMLRRNPAVVDALARRGASSTSLTSSTSLNGLGGRPAYKLVPGGSFPAFIDESSPVFERAQVIGHTLW